PASAAETEEIAGLLGGLDRVTAWKPAVERKGRTWDDQVFFKSLQSQFQEKKRLSPRQVAALRKLARGYESASKATPPTDS
ncbi:MAG: hypothetical protein U1E27_13325, partial [Kiritimatiellia bacterium]|nr:hypothetical protein [Kiritimatiellia bacterium]